MVGAFTFSSKLGIGCSGPVRAGTASLDARSTTFPSLSYASTTALLPIEPQRTRVTLFTGFGKRISTGIDSLAIALRMPFRGVFRCGKNITLPAARLVEGGRDRANTTPWSE